MDTALKIVGWVVVLLVLPHFVATAFARHIGVVLALNRVHPGALDAADGEVDRRAKMLGAAVIPYWITAGGYWLSQWEALRWVWIAYTVLLVFMWFSGVRAVKRRVGL